MEVVVVLDQRYSRTPDGAIWTSAQFGYRYWTRYLAEFERVRVVARVQDLPQRPEPALRADGEGVVFAPIPYYLGPVQFMTQQRQVVKAANAALTGNEAVVIFAPCPIGSAMLPKLKRTGQPYAVCVIADPYDIFAPGIFHHPLRPYFRWLFTQRLRRECRGASAALYVTQHSLQRRYPAAPDVPMIGCSNVYLPEAAFVAQPRVYSAPPALPHLVVVGAMRNFVKGIDVLLDALARCFAQGMPMRLTIIGEGEIQPQLEAQAAQLGISDYVHFRGQVAGEAAVRAELDQADLFVLTSRSEGLPRAVVEAMARGLPCIGTKVGGIPELLDPEDLVPPNDPKTLAIKLEVVVRSADRLTQMSQRNLSQARAYHFDRLRRQSERFYCEIKAATQAWLAQPVSAGESGPDDKRSG